MKSWTLFLALSLACAQTPLKSVIGEITAVDSAARQIKIKADSGGAVTVGLDDGTSYLRVPPGETDMKKATKIAFADVAVGDRLLARVPAADDGKLVAKTIVIITKGDLAQKHERDRAEWQKRGIAGTVTALNTTAKEITIDTHVRGTEPVVIQAASAQFRRYPADSVHFADAKSSSFEEFKTGDTIQALGEKSADGTHYQAEELIGGSFQTIAATVISVDATSGEVKITDLATKKPVSVRTNQNSLLRRLEERTAAMLARRMRPELAGAAPGGVDGGGRAGGGGRFAGGAPGAGGQGGGRGPMGADLRAILDRSPQLALADLKKGDALIISSSKGADGAPITAFSLIAGVEPFLAAAPRTAGQVDLGSWNLSVGGPEQ